MGTAGIAPTSGMDAPDDGLGISCASCEACCCRLEVMLIGDDGIPEEFTAQDPWGGWVMRRLDDGWCAALDRGTMRCTIYEQRPLICRDYRVGASDCVEQRSRLVSQPSGGR